MSGNKLKGTGQKESILKTRLNELLHKFITWLVLNLIFHNMPY